MLPGSPMLHFLSSLALANVFLALVWIFKRESFPVLAAICGGAMIVSACTTPPTAGQQAGIQVAVDVATGLAIQQKDSDPAVWKARAAQYRAIATQLQTLNSMGTATLATLAADLQPMIGQLPPAEQLAARSLVAALTPYLNAQLRDNPTLATTQAAVGAILAEFILACDTYAPRS